MAKRGGSSPSVKVQQTFSTLVAEQLSHQNSKGVFLSLRPLS